MKKAFLFITVSLLCGLAFSQNGEIIYTDFEPDKFVDYYPTEDNPMPDVFIDIDQDGTDDFVFHAENAWGRMIKLVLKRKDENAQYADWKLRMPYLLYDENDYLPILGDTIYVGDTIANIEESWYARHTFFYNLHHHIGDIPHIAPDDHCFISVRKAVDGGYCYGWINAIIYIPPENQVDDYHIYLTVCDMAYCSVPNYPLRVGQTNFSWDVVENESTLFATLHPNPTTGKVTITGKDLKQAEVFNTLGQHVATTKGEGERMTVDISALPAGVYFVNVTDKDGRKCVRKVVKE